LIILEYQTILYCPSQGVTKVPVPYVCGQKHIFVPPPTKLHLK